MARNDGLQKDSLGAADVFDGLPRLRFRKKTDKVTGMTGFHRDANFAIGLEAAYSRSVSGAWIDDHERPLQRIRRGLFRREDPNQKVVDWPLEGSPVNEQFCVILQDVRDNSGGMQTRLFLPSSHDIEIENASLPRVILVGEQFIEERNPCKRIWN